MNKFRRGKQNVPYNQNSFKEFNSRQITFVLRIRLGRGSTYGDRFEVNRDDSLKSLQKLPTSILLSPIEMDVCISQLIALKGDV